MTTVADIRQWLDDADENDTHMIVVCDTFSYDDYPVYVNKGQNVRDEVNNRKGKNMQTVMEVYDLSKDHEKQLDADRVHNL